MKYPITKEDIGKSANFGNLDGDLVSIDAVNGDDVDITFLSDGYQCNVHCCDLYLEKDLNEKVS